MNRSLLATLLVLVMTLVSLPALAKTVMLKGATIHTVSGEVLKEGVVTVDSQSGKILGVGGAGTISEKGIDLVVDVTGKVITPGLIDADSSLGLVEISAVSSSRDTDNGPGPMHAAYRAEDAFNPRSAIIPVQRPGGVTGVVIAPSGGIFSGQSAYVELGAPGATTQFASVRQNKLAHYIHMGAGAGKTLGGSRATALGYIRGVFEDLGFFMKNRDKFNQNASRALSAKRVDFLALEPLLKQSMPLVVRASRASDIEAAIGFATTRGLKLVIEGAEEGWMVAEKLAANKVAVLINPIRNLPSSFSALASRADNAALMAQKGVEVSFVTSDSHNTRHLRQFAGNAVRAGLSHPKALYAITLAPAKAFGLEKQVGSIEVGKRANLVVWSGDPFEFSTQVVHLFIGGEEASLNHRQQQLFERYKTLGRRGEPAPQNVP